MLPLRSPVSARLRSGCTCLSSTRRFCSRTRSVTTFAQGEDDRQDGDGVIGVREEYIIARGALIQVLVRSKRPLLSLSSFVLHTHFTLQDGSGSRRPHGRLRSIGLDVDDRTREAAAIPHDAEAIRC